MQAERMARTETRTEREKRVYGKKMQTPKAAPIVR
jgi:hypothetical protein